MELKTGYKQTEVGIIPEDWISESLENISAFITKGSTPTTYGYKWEQSGILFLRSECVSENGLDLTQSMFISAAAHATLRRSEVCDGDILITITGNVGRAVFLLGISSANINQHIAKVRITSNPIDSKYIYHYLSQASIRKKFNTITTGQAYPQISLKQVRETLVFFPPTKTEQAAIATALSDTDALINALDKLITKKRLIKQGAMQQLLSGKKRLASFGSNSKYKQTEVGDIPEDWTVEKLLNVAPLQRGFDLPSTELKKGIYPVIYSNGILNYHVQYKVKGQGVITGRSGTIGKVTFINENYYPHNTTLWVTDFKGNEPKFIYYLYGYIGFERFSTGSGVPTLNRNDVHIFQVPLPTKKEQTAIAQILSDMDNEIAALETKLAKIKNIKLGMMQELLTGKIRLL